ncbi:hypothetical protein IHN63_16200 [Deinococcus sp. 6YEL10]|uniref:hypothetical protein n=1 Tax=Deinococcus sp. 6YEL10 TaxID=2745870 RepID=UPI001E32F0B4|nr:hypothetical protein [Deinococcus sp. 6YEL10]MCD0162834.1 hypothetical protein [Deinococcus sp. 6YEL10]
MQGGHFAFFDDEIINNKKSNMFSDRRFPTGKMEAHQKISSSRDIESKIDKMLSIYEEVLVLKKFDMLIEDLTVPILNKIDRCLAQREIIKYLHWLERYSGGAETSLYPNLIKRLRDKSSSL